MRPSQRALASMLPGLALGVGCVEEPPAVPAVAADPCEVGALRAAGTSEVGLGAEFAPIIDGQDAVLTLGLARLWQLAVNARVLDLDVGEGDLAGAVAFHAYAEDQRISLDLGCRVRAFAPARAGGWQLASPYHLTLDPGFSDRVEGATITLEVEVHDRHGHQARSARRVVARLPPR